MLHAGSVPHYAGPVDVGLPRLRLRRERDHPLLRGAAGAAADGDHHRHPLRHALEPLRHEFRGVHWREIAKLVKPLPEARFVVAHAEQDFTSNVPLAGARGRARARRLGGRRRAADARPRVAAPPGRPVALLLEEREVAARPRDPHQRPAGLLGALRLPQRRRLLERGAVRVLVEESLDRVIVPSDGWSITQTRSTLPHSPEEPPARAALRFSALGRNAKGRLAPALCSDQPEG